MKTYIFLTTDGSTQSSAGCYNENVQVLNIIQSEDELSAYNQFLEKGVNLEYDSCYCLELVSDKVMGTFDLINDG